jgi:hypothetical protein
MPDDEIPKWQQKAHQDRGKLEAAVRKAGPDGLTQQQLREVVGMGKQRFDEAVRLFGAPFVERTKERRMDSRGHTREQVVFRHSIADEGGRVPARASRDPADRESLAELELIAVVAQAKAAGRRNPDAVARWILAQPGMFANQLAQWIDLETPLTERVAALEKEAV